jgi:hypothetical protein
MFLVQMEAKKAPVSLKPGNGFMYEFPWEFMGNYKYALFLPFVYVLASGQDDSDNWCYHILMIALLRYVQVSNFLLPPSAPFAPPNCLSMFLRTLLKLRSCFFAVLYLEFLVAQSPHLWQDQNPGKGC